MPARGRVQIPNAGFIPLENWSSICSICSVGVVACNTPSYSGDWMVSRSMRGLDKTRSHLSPSKPDPGSVTFIHNLLRWVSNHVEQKPWTPRTYPWNLLRITEEGRSRDDSR